jgi:predicted ATP-dependent endonuclease of OLD family
MDISSIYIQKFRKLYQCHIDFSKDKTLFVGANNSGKTSAMDALGKFLAGKGFVFNDFTLSNREIINNIGQKWSEVDFEKPDSISEWSSLLPAMDVWLDVAPQDIHYVINIIPTLKWRGGLLGVRMLYQPKDIATLFADYRDAYFAARKTEQSNSNGTNIDLFPKNLCMFIERKLGSYFSIKTYLLDPQKAKDNSPQETDFEMECFTDNPLKGIVKIDMISAQRGFSDPDANESGESGRTRLSAQMRGYYDKHLDPEKLPSPEDLKILEVTEAARQVFDENLSDKFGPAIKELERLGYPGIANPQITIKSRVSAAETINHDSAVQYSLGAKDDGLMLPEKYNGLGYQNLISMVFDLMSFRDGWMHKGKAASENVVIEPLHLVLVEEPEAHLHMQVQQVFIRKAYDVLRNHEKLMDKTDFSTQLVISTHSSHIAREEKFGNLRYFKRMPDNTECKVATSKVINLSDVFGTDNQTDKFVTRYLQTTHCDLFFADGAILVEGSAESMLVPHFIKNQFEELSHRYITILSINGKHSHRLSPLIDKLAIPTLVISDVDSAESTGHHKKAVPVRGKGLISGNYAITNWIVKENSLDKLLEMTGDKKVFTGKSVCDYKIRIAYQMPILINFDGKKIEALSRTFEDSLIYTNMKVFKDIDSTDTGALLSTVHDSLNSKVSFEVVQQKIFDELKNSESKAEFALDLIYTVDPKSIVVPKYIQEGLEWLQTTLCSEE